MIHMEMNRRHADLSEVGGNRNSASSALVIRILDFGSLFIVGSCQGSERLNAGSDAGRSALALIEGNAKLA
jgi:hypothetical protein